MTKICSKCRVSKGVGDFNKNRSTSDGYHYQCKSCRKQELPKRKEYNKRYYQDHKEKNTEHNKAWYRNNKERHKKSSHTWRNNNKDKVLINRHKRRSLKKNAIGSFTDKEWGDLCEKYGNKCAKCREGKKLTVDHIKPISKGGTNFIENIQPLCLSCNDSKGTKEIKYVS